MKDFEPIGAYRTDGGTGWAAWDKHGRTKRITAEEAATLTRTTKE